MIIYISFISHSSLCQVGFGKKHAFFVLAFTTGLREGLESIVFLVGVMGSGITLLTQMAHGLRSGGNMDFEVGTVINP